MTSFSIYDLPEYERIAARENIVRAFNELREEQIRMVMLSSLTFSQLEEEYGGRPSIPVDVGPTTACWTCDAIVRIQDSYSPKKDDRPFEQRQSLCEDCFKALEAKGVAHENLLQQI